MAIIYKQGDMFDDQSEAIVNTVNCVGVMGKGVALEFKRRWPENFKEYKKLCDAGQLVPGGVFIFDASCMFNGGSPRYLVNFPTKQHWRTKSKMSYIADGLDDLIIQLQKWGIRSVAMPPLGCGNGGLPWQDVKAVIEQKLYTIDDIDFNVYTPQNLQSVPEHQNIPLKMTVERAVLIKTIGEFEKYFGGYLTRISLQKIVYFLQSMGVRYGMAFSRNQQGPYSERLKGALQSMEEHHYISGYSDANREIRAMPGAYGAAEEFLSKNDSALYKDIIGRLALLIEGFESPYGMELLSSVHYLVAVEGQKTVDGVVKSIQAWNAHKNNQFEPREISAAYNRLNDDGFFSTRP